MGMTMLIRTSALWSQEAAGWAQAIGSIAAIFAAFVLGERQASKARRDSIDIVLLEVRNRKQAILEICRAAKLRSDLVREIFITNYAPIGRYEVYDHALIRGVIAGLESAPVYEIGEADAINAFLEIKVQCNFLIESIDALDADLDVSLLATFTTSSTAKLSARQRNIAIHCDRIDTLYTLIVKRMFGAADAS
jgi:response regulator RpfG family c-di-GMP phosphodiesterase